MRFRIEQHKKAGAFSMAWFDGIYGDTSYKNQVVLDIGADWGRTADYFLQRGAKRVIAVEGNDEWYQLLDKNAEKIKGIVPIKIWLKIPQDLEDLMQKYRPDIVKITTIPNTNCEYFLFKMSEKIVRIAKEYVFMTVNKKRYKSFLLMMKEKGFVVRVNTKHHDPAVRMVYARKIEK